MRRQRPPRVAGNSRRRWIAVGLILFAIADAALITLALTNNRSTASTPDRATSYWAEPIAQPTPTPTPTPVAVAAAAPSRVLAALDGETAWRAASGTCPATTAEPQITTDGGATWKSTDATRPTGVTAIQSARAEGQRVASFIGLSGEDCAPQFVRTHVAGDNYASYPADLARSWYLNPASPAAVHAPDADVAAPCPSVVALSSRDVASAGILCSDNSIHTTTDAGETWSVAPSIGSAIAMTATDSGYLAAVAGTLECEGIQLVTLTGDSETAVSGCYPLDVDPVALSGAVALAYADGTHWMWAGDAVVRSTDGGVTWA